MHFWRRQYRSPRLVKRRRKLFFIKSATLIAVSIVLVGFLSWLSFNEHITISSIEVEGNSVLTEEEIISLAEERLQGKYFLLFSRKNVFLYPRAGIKETILSAHKRVREVAVKTTGFTSAKIIIKERSPYALWCEGEGDSSLEGECYFLDEDGYLYADAPDFTGNVFFKYFGTLSAHDGSVLGNQFLTVREFRELDAIRLPFSDFEPLGKAVALKIIDDKDAELLFEGGGKIFFSREGQPLELLANMQSLFDSDVFEGEDLSLLDYIDLRFGNKVYFKFR